MSFSVLHCPIQGLYEIKPNVFCDTRGFFFETYNQKKFLEAGLPLKFIQDNISFSTKGVIRGLHFQIKHPQGRLVQVLEGEVFDVAVDLRKSSVTYGKYHGVILSSKDHNMFYIPEGFAHGFCVLSDSALLAYKCTDFYHPKDESGIRYDDSTIGIRWPLQGIKPILSEKDKKLLSFKEYSSAH